MDTEGFKVSPRTVHRDLQYLQCGWWQKATAHGACNNHTAALETRPQNKQGVRDSQNPADEKGSLKVSSPENLSQFLGLCSRHDQIRSVLTQTCLRKPRCFLALILCISASLLCSDCLFFCLLAMWVPFYLDCYWLASALFYSEICERRGCLKCNRRKKVPWFAWDPCSSSFPCSARDSCSHRHLPWIPTVQSRIHLV